MKLKNIFITLLLMFISLSAFATYSPEQVKEIQKIVDTYIQNNPDVVVNAIKSYQAKQEIAREQESKGLVNKFADKIFDTTDKPVVGDKDSQIVLVELFDYQCPHCQAVGQIIDNIIKANPKLKTVFLEFPIGGQNSIYAAKAALAAMKQNKYYDFHMALTKKGAPLTKDDILQVAKSVNIDINQLQKDIKADAITNQLKQNFDLANKIKIAGTPTLILGNIKTKKFNYFEGYMDQKDLQKEIDKIK